MTPDVLCLLDLLKTKLIAIQNWLVSTRCLSLPMSPFHSSRLRPVRYGHGCLHPAQDKKDLKTQDLKGDMAVGHGFI